MYFWRVTPSVGIEIIKKVDENEFHVAVMRWTDGLRPDVEEAVREDARRIVACLNFCKGIDTQTLEDTFSQQGNEPDGKEESPGPIGHVVGCGCNYCLGAG